LVIKVEIWHKGDLWVWGWCPNVECTHSTEKARDTSLDDEKYCLQHNR